MATSFWQHLAFTDVNPLIAKLAGRPAREEDLHTVETIRRNAESQGEYEDFSRALPRLRKGVLTALLRYEKPSFVRMFWIHIIDVHISIFAALLSVQILRTFEAIPTGLAAAADADRFVLVRTLFANPTAPQKFAVAAGLALFVFLLNVFAAALHAQKIEREMLLVYRIQTRLAAYIQNFVFAVSRQAKVRIPTGEITNLAQNDARRIAEFFAHGMIDFPVLFVSVGVILCIMVVMLGPAAWVGLGIVLLQIPLSSFFSWTGSRLQAELMRRSDKRISLVTEWVQAARLVRYFGWSEKFASDIRKAALGEFRQEMKLKTQFSLAFGLSTNWSLVVCIGIFAGFLWFGARRGPSEIFASIWLAAILGHQLNPLPWFVSIFTESRVGGKRIRTLLSNRTQAEEFEPLADVRAAVKKVLTPEVRARVQDLLAARPPGLRFGYAIESVTVKFEDARTPLFENLTLRFAPGTLTAITGSVGVGKSILLQLLLGDVVPVKGVVWLEVEIPTTDTDSTNAPMELLRVPLHDLQVLEFVRAFQTYVPQEAFVASATVRENVPLRYLAPGEAATPSEDARIVESLYLASLDLEERTFPDGLETELGERGVNLSGGQKQRLSLSRSVYAGVNVVLLDDPMSAVDQDTERVLVERLFDGTWHGGTRTIVWSTHRLEFIGRAHQIIDLDSFAPTASSTPTSVSRFSGAREDGHE